MDAPDEYATSAELHDQGRSVAAFIESALGERPTVNTDSPAMLAAQTGHSVDASRRETFTDVVSYLASIAPRVLPAGPVGVAPFFEAYFSNFIEGTEFTVDEAREIVEEGHIPQESTRRRSRHPRDARGDHRSQSGRRCREQPDRVRRDRPCAPPPRHGRSPHQAARQVQGPDEPCRQHRVRRSAPGRRNPSGGLADRTGASLIRSPDC